MDESPRSAPRSTRRATTRSRSSPTSLWRPHCGCASAERGRESARARGGRRVNEVYRYLTLAVSPEWRRAEASQRAADKREFAAAGQAAGAVVHAFSLVGTRADADLLLWAVGDDLEALRALETRLAATRLWTYSTRPYAYLAARRRSPYLGGHSHDGAEHIAPAGPVGDKRYVVVYPMTKKRSWYALPHEERTRIM